MRHGTLGGYVNRKCRCLRCSAEMSAYMRRYHATHDPKPRVRGGWKAMTVEPPREPLANIVVLPGAPRTTCPECSTASLSKLSLADWPAIGMRPDGRYLYQCAAEPPHRWVA